MNQFLPSPQCIRLYPSVQSQCQAIQQLIRPWEVAHLVRSSPAWALPAGHCFSEDVARWLKGQLGSWGLRYISDPEGPFDYWYSPGATLERGGGDCEDLSILATSMLHRGGQSAFVVTGTLRTQNGVDGHAWIEGRDEVGWFLIEATSGDFCRHFRPACYKPSLFLSPGLCELAA